MLTSMARLANLKAEGSTGMSVVDRAERELDLNRPAALQLFSLLRGRIVEADLVPGTRLSEAEMAVHYGVSRQPVREAFIKLADVRLLEIRPQRGTYVRAIDAEAVHAAQFVREAVEADIVRHAARRAGPEDIGALEGLLVAQENVAGLADSRPFIELDERFHSRLAAVAGQGAGWAILQPLKVQMDRVRHLSARRFPRFELLEQHRRILAAIAARRPEDAADEMRLHLGQILVDLPAVMEALPSYFSVKTR